MSLTGAATTPRERLRRLGSGLATVTGLARHGFYIPCRYAARLPRAGGRAPYDAVERLFAGFADDFRAALARLHGWTRELAAIGADDPAPGPRWNQDWFPRLDAAMAYAMVRDMRPARIVEVGSGHSTRFMARAIADGELATRLTAVDPAPRATLDRLALTLVREPLHRSDPALPGELEANDILFIDSSHVAMPGSDVDQLFCRVLPGLAPGVLVHIHDIFLPDDYPAAWDWRGYNEQIVVAPLLCGGAWQPLFASHYMATRHRAEVEAGLPAGLFMPPGARESSLWLRRA